MESIVIFAGGKGTRMKEITQITPKPLIKIREKPLLQYALEFTKRYNFDRIIINTHHLSEQIAEFIKKFKEANPQFPEIIIEHEELLLETGGTIKKLARLYDLGERIFTLNSDIIIQAESNVFHDLLEVWSQKNPDLLLLLQDTKKAFGYIGEGDFNLESDYRINRSGSGSYKYIFSGLQILNPCKISSHPADIFSLQEFFPQGPVYEKVNLRATTMNGWWYHASCPEDIKVIESQISF